MYLCLGPIKSLGHLIHVSYSLKRLKTTVMPKAKAELNQLKYLAVGIPLWCYFKDSCKHSQDRILSLENLQERKMALFHDYTHNNRNDNNTENNVVETDTQSFFPLHKENLDFIGGSKVRSLHYTWVEGRPVTNFRPMSCKQSCWVGLPGKLTKSRHTQPVVSFCPLPFSSFCLEQAGG